MVVSGTDLPDNFCVRTCMFVCGFALSGIRPCMRVCQTLRFRNNQLNKASCGPHSGGSPADVGLRPGNIIVPNSCRILNINYHLKCTEASSGNTSAARKALVCSWPSRQMSVVSLWESELARLSSSTKRQLCCSLSMYRWTQSAASSVLRNII